MQAALANSGYVIDYKAEKSANKTIEKQIAKDAKKEASTIRILVLGTGDSGKSTFIKQMMLQHIAKNPFLPAQITSFKKALRRNALESLETLCKTFIERQPGHELVAEAKKLQPLVRKALGKEDLPMDLAVQMAAFWQNKAIKNIFEERDRLQIHTSTVYYLDNVLRFADINWTPSADDILHCRERTSGVHETLIQAEGLYILFIDVGGQKAERRKWISCFNTCTMIIYVAALDSYSRVLEEDGKTNRLTDSLNCFREITAHKHLQNIPFQVFLNKSDVYEKTWKQKKIGEVFPECRAESAGAGIKWISQQFEKAYQGTEKLKFFQPLVTNVLDTKTISTIWAVCRGIIVGSAMGEGEQHDFTV